MKFSKLKLWIKFSVSFVFIFLFVIITLSYQFIAAFSENLKNQYVERGKKIVDTLAFNSKNFVVNKNIIELTI
ncbi:MAG: hypothetical protein N2Z73_03265 [Endomicrobia bacterium]|nr:hypothetical protein [Endomicrobiia bacterium]